MMRGHFRLGGIQVLFPLALTVAATAAELSIPHEHYELDNGLDVILVEDHSTPIVHVNVWYHVGSRSEEQGLTGFAHLFEHLMFQGSLSQPGEYFDPLSAVGASINGTTNTDRTNYFETVPAEYLPMALFLESDRMGWLLPELTLEKLDNQREVVKNERRQRYENPPFGTAWMELMAAVWPEGHPYRHTTIGSHEDLSNASLDDVKAFFTKWYVPDNASLAVVGDFDPATAKSLIDEYFGTIERGPEPLPPWEFAPAAIPASKEVRLFQEVPEQRVWIAWTSPALYEPGDAELDLFNQPLASGKDSRLYRALVDTGIAKSVDAYQASSMLASIYIVQATAAAGHDTDEIVAIVDEVLASITTDQPPTAEEIEAARANYEAGFFRRMRTIAGVANLAQFYNLAKGEPDWVARDLARYDRTPEQVVAAAQEVLSQPRVVMHIWPEPAEAEAAPEVVAETVGFWARLFGGKKAVSEPSNPTAQGGE